MFTDEQVRASHTIDDLATELGRYKRTTKEVATLLGDLPYAIDHGALDVAQEYIDRSLVLLANVRAGGAS